MPHTRTASEIFDSLVSKGGEVLPPRHLSVRIFAFDGMQAQEKSRTQFTSGRAGLASDWPRKQYVCSSVVRLVCTSIFSHLQSSNPGQNV